MQNNKNEVSHHCLINCFALNDHVDNKRKKQTIFDFPLDSFSNFFEINLTALFSVCREFARNNKKGTIINFSATTGIVSPRPDLYDGAHKHPGYSISKAGVILSLIHISDPTRRTTISYEVLCLKKK